MYGIDIRQVPLEVVLKPDVSLGGDVGVVRHLRTITPCLLPDLNTIARIKVRSPRFWPLDIDMNRFSSINNLVNSQNTNADDNVIDSNAGVTSGKNDENGNNNKSLTSSSSSSSSSFSMGTSLSTLLTVSRPLYVKRKTGHLTYHEDPQGTYNFSTLLMNILHHSRSEEDEEKELEYFEQSALQPSQDFSPHIFALKKEVPTSGQPQSPQEDLLFTFSNDAQILAFATHFCSSHLRHSKLYRHRLASILQHETADILPFYLQLQTLQLITEGEATRPSANDPSYVKQPRWLKQITPRLIQSLKQLYTYYAQAEEERHKYNKLMSKQQTSSSLVAAASAAATVTTTSSASLPYSVFQQLPLHAGSAAFDLSDNIDEDIHQHSSVEQTLTPDYQVAIPSLLSLSELSTLLNDIEAVLLSHASTMKAFILYIQTCEEMVLYQTNHNTSQNSSTSMNLSTMPTTSPTTRPTSTSASSIIFIHEIVRQCVPLESISQVENLLVSAMSEQTSMDR